MNINRVHKDNDKEVYVFLKRLEEVREIDSFDAFLLGSEKSVTIDYFLSYLHKIGKCSSLFIKNYYEDYPDRNCIYFSENLIEEIMKLEDYRREEAKNCFIWTIALFISNLFDEYQLNRHNGEYEIPNTKVKMNNFFFNILDYCTKRNLTQGTDIYELTSDNSPIFYTSYAEVNSIPAYVENYTFTVESSDEDEVYLELTKGVAISAYKKYLLDSLFEDLEDISEDLELTLVKRIKTVLGLK